MVEELGGKERMDWSISFFILAGIWCIGLAIGVVFGAYYQDNSRLSDLNSSFLQLREADVNIQQGLNVLYIGEFELARGIQDVNSRIVLNEQALATLNYLNSQACQRSDTNETMTIRCLK